MDYTDFMVDRAQHMRPLEYDLSDNFNGLLRYMHDMGVLDNVPVATLGPSEILSASDALSAPLRSLVVGGSSVQDGTPTPDAPVPILSVDDLSLVCAGKNLLDLASNVDTSAFLGIAKTVNADGSLTFSGTAVTTYTYITNEFYSSLPIGSYTLSISQTLPHSVYINIKFEDGTEGNHSILAGQTIRTFTITKPVAKMRVIAAYMTAGTSYNETFTIQLERGSSATAFVPYIGTTVPDLLPEGTDLRSLPDGTKDELHLAYLRPSTREGWAWYSREVMKRCDIVTLDGTQSWFLSASGTYTRFGCSSVRLSACTLIADKLTYYQIGDLLTHPYGINAHSNNRIYVSLDETVTTEAQAKAWFAANNVTTQYKLPSPVTTQLDPIELPTLPAPNCTVWCDGGSATPQLTAEYIRNLSASISDMQAAIADIISG